MSTVKTTKKATKKNTATTSKKVTKPAKGTFDAIVAGANWARSKKLENYAR